MYVEAVTTLPCSHEWVAPAALCPMPRKALVGRSWGCQAAASYIYSHGRFQRPTDHFLTLHGLGWRVEVVRKQKSIRIVFFRALFQLTPYNNIGHAQRIRVTVTIAMIASQCAVPFHNKFQRSTKNYRWNTFRHALLPWYRRLLDTRDIEGKSAYIS